MSASHRPAVTPDPLYYAVMFTFLRNEAGPIDAEEYLLTCYRYIELNPVRAGMVASPGDYRWSSYACNTNGVVDELVVPHELYLGLGNNPETRHQAYRALFRSALDSETI